MSTETKYEERYCAFVDILGFGQLIEQLRQDNSRYPELRTLLQVVHSPRPAIPTRPEPDLRAQSISDAVAVSAAINVDGLRELSTHSNLWHFSCWRVDSLSEGP
jgi:hypothetical protein